MFSLSRVWDKEKSEKHYLLKINTYGMYMVISCQFTHNFLNASTSACLASENQQ